MTLSFGLLANADEPAELVVEAKKFRHVERRGDERPGHYD